ncbi:MAG: hypothetical protein GX254_09540 [Clostridiales bacterium]|jgi:hypothetical protein|nr:hypothetical protein [Clostridiales bacterium]
MSLHNRLYARTINRYEVEALFRDVFSLRQREHIGNLLKLLGLYVFVDRQQLEYFAEKHFGSKIGL